jgi:hypothetical protein
MSYAHVMRQLARFTPDDPVESCGVIAYRYADARSSLRKPDYLSFHQLKNSHHDPAHAFGILDVDFGRWSGSHPEWALKGWLHTHPGRDPLGWVPSDLDMQRADDLCEDVHMLYHPFTRSLIFYGREGARDYIRARPKWRAHGQDRTLAGRHAWPRSLRLG